MPCLTPYTVKSQIKCVSIGVPCGRCPDCVGKRISGWSFRLMQQVKISVSATFVTLTYDERHLPLSGLGLKTLRKDHLQGFFKRLRDRHTRNKYSHVPIKYYAVGEYGTKFKRPHYHIILFNAVLDDVEAAWVQGTKFYGTVQGESIGYCLKYLSKEKGIIGVAVNDDREKEFGLMSKGLGLNYFTSQMVDYHMDDLPNRTHLTVGDMKVAMPRYYKDKLFSDNYFPSIEDAKRVRMEIGLYNKRRMENQEVKDRQAKGDGYSHDRVERDKMKFLNMKRNSEKDNIF